MASPVPWYETPLTLTLLSGGAVGVLTVLGWIGGFSKWLAKRINHPSSAPVLPPVPANSISVAPTITTEVSPSIAPVFHVDTMARSTAHPDDVEERDFYISVSDIITPMDQYLTLSSRTPELVQSLISANAQLQTELRDHQRVIDPAAYTKLSTLSEAVACALVVLNADPEARKGAEEMFFGPDGMGGSVARTARYAREAIRVRTKEMRSRH